MFVPKPQYLHAATCIVQRNGLCVGNPFGPCACTCACGPVWCATAVVAVFATITTSIPRLVPWLRYEWSQHACAGKKLLPNSTFGQHRALTVISADGGRTASLNHEEFSVTVHSITLKSGKNSELRRYARWSDIDFEARAASTHPWSMLL